MTHAVVDIERWLDGKAERAAAIGSFGTNVTDYVALEPWARTWQHWASDGFLRGYRSTIGDAPLLPAGDSFEALLRAFTLDKALSELAYELNNRPEWIGIPLEGLLTLLK